MSKRDNDLLLQDIIEAAQKILRYTQDLSFESFIDDEKTIDAVIRNFEIIGEAASRLSEDFKSTHSNINWKKLKGFRNRLVHEYFGVDHKILWSIVQNELAVLIVKIKI